MMQKPELYKILNFISDNIILTTHLSYLDLWKSF